MIQQKPPKMPKIAAIVQKELRKISPQRASLRVLCPASPTVLENAEKNNLEPSDRLSVKKSKKNIHERTNKSEKFKRFSSLTPYKYYKQKIYNSPAEEIKDKAVFEEMNEKKVEIANEIMKECDQAQKTSEKNGLPKIFRSYSREILRMVDKIDGFLENKVEENEETRSLTKNIENRIVKELRKDERKKNTLDYQIEKAKIERRVWQNIIGNIKRFKTPTKSYHEIS